MKKHLQILFFAFCLFALTACGAENNILGNQNNASEFYDILVEETEVFHTEMNNTYLGVQFYGEDIIQILLGQDGVRMLNADGGSEIVLPEYGFFTGNWFLTSEGKSILFYEETYGGGVRVLDKSGEGLFSLDDVLGLSICETEKGTVYLLAEEDDRIFLGELDMENGLLKKLECPDIQQPLYRNVAVYQSLGIGPEGPMLMDSEGIWKLEIKENEAAKSIFMPFDGTSYMAMLSDPISNPNYNLRNASGFRVLKDGSAEVLWKYVDSGKGLLQVLRYEKMEKQVLRLRCTDLSGWMAECITAFNQSNDNYQVILERLAANQTDMSALEDFQQRTDMEIGAGKGADLIIGQASGNFSALQEKGVLEDLTPYLEQSGINREDYFPITFAQKEDQETVYGIAPAIYPMSLWISQEVLGETEEQDIETVVNALNDYSGNGSIGYSWPSISILSLLSIGSENFWGMIDYENQSCDFDTELFRKILNVAERYGDSSYMDSPAIIGERQVKDLGNFERAEELAAQGKTALGYIFDDGIYSLVATQIDVIAVNTNSPNKDGCWEFISFLLQEENQRKLIEISLSFLPVNRKVFAEYQAHELEWSGKIEYLTAHLSISHGECTEADAAEQLELMENLHSYPLNDGEVWKIVWDEAKDYIDGLKPMDTIIENINNRVQLYLNER